MIITPSTDPQVLTIIPNVSVTDGDTGTVRLTRNGADDTAEVPVTLANNNEWVNVSGTFTVVEGAWYSLTLIIDNNEVYRDIVYATSQEPDEYRILTATDAVLHESDNTFNLPNDE